jgi:hypothetical protein
LLNGLARYLDYANIGAVYPKPTDAEGVYSLGAIGPFGVVLMTQDDSSQHLCQSLQKLCPEWRLPLIQVPAPILPIQRDSVNCGIFTLIFIMDFMLTQYDYDYTFEAMKYDNTDTYVVGADFGEHLFSQRNITLPPNNKLGTGLFGMPITTLTDDGVIVCELLRIELVALAERHHILFYNAFTKEGHKTNSKVLGRLPQRYTKLTNTHHFIKRATQLFGKRITTGSLNNANKMEAKSCDILSQLAGKVF